MQVKEKASRRLARAQKPERRLLGEAGNTVTVIVTGSVKVRAWSLIVPRLAHLSSGAQLHRQEYLKAGVGDIFKRGHFRKRNKKAQ